MNPPPSMIPAPTLRAFIAGNSGSGKTTLANRLYLTRYPRVLILDLTGEWEGKVDASAGSVPELVAVMRNMARERGRWKISAGISPAELPQLVDWLIPVPDLKRSPILAMHGAAILVDEVDLLAPPGTAKEEVRTLYRRSRHVGLSVVSTTQRPANVSREVSSQSLHAVALSLNEPRDVKYMADLMRWSPRDISQWKQWTRRHRHGGQWRNLQTGQTLWIPESGIPERQGPTPPELPGLSADDDDDDWENLPGEEEGEEETPE